MKTQAYVIEQLLGMQPWRSSGSTELRPTLLERLSFSRPEGYEPVENDTLDTAGALTHPSSAFAKVEGSDPSGLAALLLDSGDVALVRGHTYIGASSWAGSGTRAYVPTFGMYGSHLAFSGVTNKDDITDSTLDEPNVSLTIENASDGVTENSDGALEASMVCSVVVLKVVPTPAGRLVVGAVSAGWGQDDPYRVEIAAPSPAAAGADQPDLQYEVYVNYNIISGGPGTFLGGAQKKYHSGREYILSMVLEPGDTEWLQIADVGSVLPDTGHTVLAGMQDPTTPHGGRLWFRPDASNYNRVEKAWSYKGGTSADQDTIIPTDDLGRSLTLAYSELGYVNLGGVTNYLFLPPGTSTEITGMVSTPSGLMVFGENDAWIISGDPALGNLQVESFPAAVGCDAGQSPIVAGGRVFTIWNNKLYALEGANAVDASRGILVDTSSPLDVASDPTRNSIAVLTSKGILRFDLASQEWYRDTPSPGVSWSTSARLLPAADGLRIFYPATDSILEYQSGLLSAVSVTLEWLGLDAGDPFRRDLWRYVRIPLGLRGGTYSVGSTPYLYYRTRDADPDVSAEDSGHRVTGSLTDGELVFKLPWGVWGRRVDLRIVMDLGQGATIQPGISIGFVPGHAGDSL